MVHGLGGLRSHLFGDRCRRIGREITWKMDKTIIPTLQLNKYN